MKLSVFGSRRKRPVGEVSPSKENDKTRALERPSKVGLDVLEAEYRRLEGLGQGASTGLFGLAALADVQTPEIDEAAEPKWMSYPAGESLEELRLSSPEVTAELPILVGQLQDVADRLAGAIREVHGLKRSLVPHIHILDTAQWVLETDRPQRREEWYDSVRWTSTNGHDVHHVDIYLSVAALRDILRTPGVSAERSMEELFLAVAHEIAHSIENVDPDARTYGASPEAARGSAQYLEFKADADAAVLAHHIGLSPSALLRLVGRYVGASKGAVSALAGSHPDRWSRLHALSLTISALRQEHGVAHFQSPPPVDSSELEWLESSFSVATERARQKAFPELPADFDTLLKIATDEAEGAQKQEAQSSNCPQLRVKRAKLERTVRAAHRALAGTAAHLNDDELRERLVSLGRTVHGVEHSRVSFPFLLSDDEVRELYRNDASEVTTDGTSFVDPSARAEGTFSDFWGKLPTEYRHRVTALLPAVAWGEPRSATQPSLLGMLRLAPPDVAVEAARSKIVAQVHQHSRSLVNEYSAAVRDRSGEAWLAFSAIVGNTLAPMEPFDWFAVLFHMRPDRGGFPQPFPLPTTIGVKATDSAAATFFSSLKGRTDAPAIEYKVFLDRVFADLGSWALVDLLHPTLTVDWDAVALARGITPEACGQAVRAALLEKLESPDLSSWLAAAQKAHPDFKPRKYWDGVPYPSKVMKGFRYVDEEVAAAVAKAVEPFRTNPATERFAVAMDIAVMGVPNRAAAEYRKCIDRAIAQAQSGPEEIDLRYLANLHERLVEERKYWRTSSVHAPMPHSPACAIQPAHMDALLEAISVSSLPNKDSLIRELISDEVSASFARFGRGEHSRLWITYSNPQTLVRHLDLLVRHGALSSDVATVVRQHRAWLEVDPPSILSLDGNFAPNASVDVTYGKHFSFCDALSTRLMAELDEKLRASCDDTARAALIEDYANIVFEWDAERSREKGFQRSLFSQPLEKYASDLIERYRALNRPLPENLALHQRLTSMPPCPATDVFLEQLYQAPGASTLKLLKAYGYAALQEGRVQNPELAVEIARLVLEDAIAMTSSNRSTPALEKLFLAIDQLLPRSAARDELLEQLGYALDLELPELETFVEPSKTTNWRAVPAWLGPMLSSLSSLSQDLEGEDRADFIRFLIKPEGHLPPNVARHFARHVHGDATDVIGSVLGKVVTPGQDEASARESDMAMLAMHSFEGKVRAAGETERAILIGFLLFAGDEAPLSDSHPDIEGIITKFCDADPSSLKRQLMSCLVEVLPEEEQALSLGLILAHAGGGAASDGGDLNLARLAEVFKTPGLKMAQLVKVWDLFGEELSASAAEAQDNTKGLSRAQYLRVVGDSLNRGERALLPRPAVERLAAASIKTAVKGTRIDGTDVAVLARHPEAGAQVNENMDILKRYVDRMAEKQLLPNEAFFKELLKDFEEMLFDEIDLTREPGKIALLQQGVSELNAKMKLDDWKFVVTEIDPDFHPGPDLMVLKLATGKSLRSLVASEDKGGMDEASFNQILAACAELQLRLMFEYGLVSADPHFGNFWLDPATKQVFVMDPGQLRQTQQSGPRESDERYVFARFLDALDKRDVDQLVRLGNQMIRTEGVSDDKKQELAEKLRAACADVPANDSSQLLRACASAFAEVDAPFRSLFTVGMFKELLVLRGERFLPERQFDQLVEKVVREFITRQKLPRYVLDRARGR